MGVRAPANERACAVVGEQQHKLLLLCTQHIVEAEAPADEQSVRGFVVVEEQQHKLLLSMYA